MCEVHLFYNNRSTKLTRKEMDNAITVFQAKLKAEYQLFVKTKSWSHSQVCIYSVFTVYAQ